VPIQGNSLGFERKLAFQLTCLQSKSQLKASKVFVFIYQEEAKQEAGLLLCERFEDPLKLLSVFL
jgi:hypothetical protein